MRKELSNDVLMDLYKKNYTLKEIALLHGYNPCTIHRRVSKLIEEGTLERRPAIRKNRATIYGNDDRITINIKDDKCTRVITDEDIMTLIGFGFKESRISLITGIPVIMIKDIVSKYKEHKLKGTKINKSYIIDLYNNKFNRSQIVQLTGYDAYSVSAVVNQAIRCGFINRHTNYVPTSKERTIIEMYRNMTPIHLIAKAVTESKEYVEEVISRLIEIGLMDERNTASRIINRKRIGLGIEDENIVKLYNLCISEEVISNYYKVSKNTIIKALSQIDGRKIKIYDRISDLLKKKKTIRQISYILDVPTEVLYDHLREITR